MKPLYDLDSQGGTLVTVGSMAYWLAGDKVDSSWTDQQELRSVAVEADRVVLGDQTGQLHLLVKRQVVQSL